MDTRTAIEGLRGELAAAFVEREREIEGLIVAALAREHVLLIGPPGTAKSAIARAFAASIGGADYFERLLTRFSVPEELFGPISMAGLREDRYVRVSGGMVQRSHVAFLDEIFKANSAILNSLLALVNERTFHDGNGVQSAPLMTAIGASNELPEGEELTALYDRFLVRFWTHYTTTPDAFDAVLFEGDPIARVTTRIPLASWRDAQAEVAALPVDRKGLGGALFALRGELAAEGITVSDRRWRKCVGLVRAAAWLDGADVASAEHLSVLATALWNTPEQAPKVAQIVARYASPEIASATEIHDAAIDLISRMPAEGSPGFLDAAKSTYREAKIAISKVSDVEVKAKSASSKRRIAGLRLALEAAAARVRSAGRKAAEF